GISRQVVSLSPLWLFHTAPAPVATAFARRANDLLAEWCGADRTRLAGMASLPAQDVGAAIVELERSVTELGLVGGYIGTDARPGLDDPDLDDLYSACVDLDVPLFVHSTMGRVGASVVDPRLDRWMGGVIYGYPVTCKGGKYEIVK
ncbi:MAG: amidohydrolase family protein, partial [Actinomycetota bacterium]